MSTVQLDSEGVAYFIFVSSLRDKSQNVANRSRASQAALLSEKQRRKMYSRYLRIRVRPAMINAARRASAPNSAARRATTGPLGKWRVKQQEKAIDIPLPQVFLLVGRPAHGSAICCLYMPTILWLRHAYSTGVVSTPSRRAHAVACAAARRERHANSHASWARSTTGAKPCCASGQAGRLSFIHKSGHDGVRFAQMSPTEPPTPGHTDSAQRRCAVEGWCMPTMSERPHG